MNSDHTAMQLLLRSLELFRQLEESLCSEMTKDEQQAVYTHTHAIMMYFTTQGWHIGYDDFRGIALCVSPPYTSTRKESDGKTNAKEKRPTEGV